MKKILILLMIVAFITTSCVDRYKEPLGEYSPVDVVNPVDVVITDFEDFPYEEYLGKNVTVKGESMNFPLYVTKNYNDHFYGLMDSEGFHIKFIPRGDRHINEGQQYTIKGTVIKDKVAFCVDLEDRPCAYAYFFKEVKP
jgi:hypothetical protein